jgi:hypothetical protein
MVSQPSIMSGTATVPNRGFVPEETVMAVGPDNATVTTYYRPFWRPVLAGTLFTLSVFVLSWFLMLGCHVGIASDGVIALGAGAAVWIWVTACVAYFFGGAIASAMTLPSGHKWLKGAVIWGLSIPLALILYAFLGQSGTLLSALNLPHTGMLAGAGVNAPVGTGAHFGFLWSTFIALACGLIFSIIGSMAGFAGRRIEKEPA